MPSGATLLIIYPQDTPNTGRYKINYNFSILAFSSFTGISASKFTNPNPTTQTVGGIPAGSTFAGDYYLQDMMDLLLYPAVTPNFTSFLMASQATSVEVGSSISGLKTFTWSIANTADFQPNSIDIVDTTNSTVLATGLADDGTETVFLSSVSKTIPDSNVWTISGQDTDGNVFSRNFTVNWQYSVFYGISASPSLNAAAIQALAGSSLESDIDGSYPMVGTGYGYLCVPDSFSVPNGFRDSVTNLPIEMAGSSDGYTSFDGSFFYSPVSVTRNGVPITYRVYRTKNSVSSPTIVVGSTGSTVATLQTVIDAGNVAYGNAAIIGNFSATTFYSGSTPFNTILQNILNGSATYVQPGSNIITGGTPLSPIVSVVASPSFTSVSASTFYSGSTNLNTLLGNLVTTYVQPGLNITTGGTPSAPIIGTSANPVFTSLTSLSAFVGSLSGGTIYSGSSLLQNALTLHTVVNAGNTANRSIYLQGDGSLGALSRKVLFKDTDGTYSGTSDPSIGIDYGFFASAQLLLESPDTIFNVTKAPIYDATTYPLLLPNFYFGDDTGFVPPIWMGFLSATTNVQRTYNYIRLAEKDLSNNYGGEVLITATGTSDSSYGQFIANFPKKSGTIAMLSDVTGGTSTYVQPGTNITTGGTATLPVVSVVNNPVFQSLSATSISATTFYSGNTDLASLLAGNQDLQSVTNVGNTTTNNIIIDTDINVGDRKLIFRDSVNFGTYGDFYIGQTIAGGAGTYGEIFMDQGGLWLRNGAPLSYNIHGGVFNMNAIFSHSTTSGFFGLENYVDGNTQGTALRLNSYDLLTGSSDVILLNDKISSSATKYISLPRSSGILALESSLPSGLDDVLNSGNTAYLKNMILSGSSLVYSGGSIFAGVDITVDTIFDSLYPYNILGASIIGGTAASLSGNTNNSAIFGGSNNRIFDSPNSSILGGTSSFVFQLQNSSIINSVDSSISGNGYVFYNDIPRTIIGSKNSNINDDGFFMGPYSEFVEISNSRNSSISSSISSSIRSSIDSYILNATSYADILNSDSVQLQGLHINAIGSSQSQISASYAAIIASRNSLVTGISSIDIGGYGNLLFTNRSVALGTTGATFGSDGSVAIGGVNHYFTSIGGNNLNPSYSVILGGGNNTMNHSGSTILGGFGITSQAHNTVFMPNAKSFGGMSAATFYSGTTDLNYLLGQAATPATYVQPGINIYTGGTANSPIVGVIGSPLFTAITVSSLTGTSVSATTFYSGSTNLNYLLGQAATPATYVQPGSNITTGGTASAPVVSVNGSPSFTSVTANNFVSGSTNLNNLFASSSVQNQWTQPGVNAYTAGTANAPIIGVIGSPTFTAVTANNFISGSTNLNDLFGPSTYVSPGVNAYTGGTASRPIVGVIGSPTFTAVTSTSLSASSIFGTSVSATTFYSGSTNLNYLLGGGTGASTYVQPGSNITTGGTANAPVVSVNGSPSFTAVTANNFVSGSTNLNNLFAAASVQNQWVQPGVNVYTGGTVNAPIVGVIGSPTFTGVTTTSLSASSVFGTSVSATTFYSGATNLNYLLGGTTSSTNGLEGVSSITSTTYTFVLTDKQKLLTFSSSSSILAIIPLNSSVSFPLGTQILLEQDGAGQLRVSGTTGVTLKSYGSAYNLVGQYGTAFLTKQASDTWILDGNLTTQNL